MHNLKRNNNSLDSQIRKRQCRHEIPYIALTTYLKSQWERVRQRERKRERVGERARLEAFWSLPSVHWPDWGQVSPQCSGEPQLYTGRQIHTHSQLGLPVIRQQEERAKCTLSQNHAFINIFTEAELSPPYTGVSDGLQRGAWQLGCSMRGAEIANTEDM